MRIHISLCILFSFTIVACQPNASSRAKEAWDQANDPALMDAAPGTHKLPYSHKWGDLPLQAQLSKTPWSDHYWPTAKGGLTYRWNDWSKDTEEPLYTYELNSSSAFTSEETAALSPLEKLDLFMNHPDRPLTREERTRTGIMKTVVGSPDFDPDFTIPGWEGLCHAWAPATLAFDEPSAVTLKNPQGLDIQFGSSDVKGLLVYFLDRAKATSTVLGTRCEQDFAQLEADLKEKRIKPKDLLEARNQKACLDTNAGTFHLALANQIGRLDEGFIVDLTRDQEVWNQPVFAYTSRVLKTSLGASKRAATGTVKELTIETEMSYIQEVTQHWDAGDYDGSVRKKLYTYRLELDADDQIIGGAWISDDRPDFLWKQNLPEFTGDFKAIEAIYKASLARTKR